MIKGEIETTCLIKNTVGLCRFPHSKPPRRSLEPLVFLLHFWYTHLYNQTPLLPFTSSNHSSWYLNLYKSHFKEFPTCWFYITVTEKMSSASKAWLVAAAVGGVEALKDQGFCRWNYTLRSLHQHAKNHVRSASQAKKLSSSSSAMISNKVKEVKAKQSEESLRKVMYLSCWGPY